jgi:long-chain acyl-CoA synthetase
MIAAPAVYVMMMTRPGYRERGRALRVIGYGGAPIPPHAVTALREWRPGARLHNAYGMTETCSPTTILPDADALARISSVGLPVPTAEVRTVDPDTGRECGPDEVGELWIHGPMVVPGYWANPEATQAAVGDGWLRSGDLDRIKDMINRGGEKIFCVEVEEVLCAHPDMLEAAVLGVPDPVYGEAVKACVVPRPGRAVDPADLQRWVAGRLAKFKVPSRVEVRDALPRNPNGKVIKALLRGEQ